jgi:hypothetical protein
MDAFFFVLIKDSLRRGLGYFLGQFLGKEEGHQLPMRTDSLIKAEVKKMLQKSTLKRAVSLGLLSFCLLSGCAGGEVKKGYNLCVEDMKSSAKDPSSLQFKNQKYTWIDAHSGSDGKAVTKLYCYKMDDNGKNSYGAYVGFDTYYFSWYVDEADVTRGGMASALYSLGLSKNGEKSL